MKRVGGVFSQIAERENLRLAFWRARRGHRDSVGARNFEASLERNLVAMQESLLGGRIKVGDYHQFVIHDPKKRLITAPAFHERVLHHAVMNLCEPVFERWLIADSFACRVSKGRHACLARTQTFAARHGYFLKLDIRKYFDSISHFVLIDRLARLFKDRQLLQLFERIIASYETGRSAPVSPTFATTTDEGSANDDFLVIARQPRGLPIGALTSQYFANFYMGWFDRFVKERLRVGGYLRYMDDCALFGDSPAQLHQWLADARQFLGDELHLEPKPTPYINRTSHGMDFLGCRVFQNHMILNRRSRIRFRRKLVVFERLHEGGRISELALQQRATSLLSFAKSPGVRSWNFRSRVLRSLNQDF